MAKYSTTWTDAIRINHQFHAGMPCRVVQTADRRFTCRPFATRSGCQWFYFCVRVENLPAGEETTIDVNWPRILTAEDLPNADEEQLRRETRYDSFAKVLSKICLLSDDMTSFRRAEGVELTGEGTVSIPIRGTGRDIYIATQTPYTADRHEALLTDAEKAEPGCVRTLGLSQAGLPVSAVLLESDAGPEAPTVYIQGYQHITEFSGPLVIDAMIRHLLDGAPGRELRRKLAFHFVPAVDVDAVFYGPALMLDPHPADDLRTKNPNRDWRDLQWPEVQAVDRFLRGEAESGRRYVAGLDLHNGWHMADDSGGTYTVSGPKEHDEQTAARQKQFVDHMLARTDHEKPGNYWQHAAGGRTFKAYFIDLADTPLAHTVEFSRHMWWNRDRQQYEPYGPHHPEQFARQAAEAMVEFFT
ncbi:MAG: M14 family zinc carboxypeptidase [Phycisphaerae bacterium]